MSIELFYADIAKSNGDVTKSLCRVQRTFIRIGQMKGGQKIWSKDGGKNWNEFDDELVSFFYMVSYLVKAAIACGLSMTKMNSLKSHSALIEFLCKNVTDDGAESAAAGDEDLRYEMVVFAKEYLVDC